MAGGLFGKPFALNIKCIIFSLMIMVIFLYKPEIKNGYILYATLFGIFVASYVAMAWYDYYFDCRILPLKRGERSVTGVLKPPVYMEEQKNGKRPRKAINRQALMIYLSHILLIVPLLIYIAVYKKKVSKMTYPIIGALAVLTLGYHGFELMAKMH